MASIILLTGFEPFGGERINPSWEVARRLDGMRIGDITVRSIRLPVNCRRAASVVSTAIEEISPAAVLGLGQAGGRPALSLERVAINLAERRASRETDGSADGKAIVAGGPDAYFSRLPLAAILRALKRGNIPVALSLSAGAYVCNTVMYVGLHMLRRRRNAPAGFIHLPYEAAQAVRHRAAASMSLDLMTAGVELALRVVARQPGRSAGRSKADSAVAAGD
jgi:pyroglutamyl-peptidase